MGEGWKNHDFIYPDELKFHDGRGFNKRYVGVEIEVADMESKQDDLIKVVEKWGASIKEDCSLPYGGFEITTAPARGTKFIKQVTEICDILKLGNAKVDKSCGLHVHVDARDFSKFDVLKALLVFEKLENDLFRIGGEERRRSTYCNSWENSFNNIVNSQKETTKARHRKNWEGYCHTCTSYDCIVEEVGRRGALNVLEEEIYYGDRYKSLNILAWDDHSTLENRMHKGCIDSKQILRWSNVNSKLVDFAKNTSFKVIKSLKKSDIKDQILKD